MSAVSIDPAGDGAYIEIAPRPIARSSEEFPGLRVDYDEAEEVVGVGILNVSRLGDSVVAPFLALLAQVKENDGTIVLRCEDSRWKAGVMVGSRASRHRRGADLDGVLRGLAHDALAA